MASGLIIARAVKTAEIAAVTVIAAKGGVIVRSQALRAACGSSPASTGSLLTGSVTRPGQMKATPATITSMMSVTGRVSNGVEAAI